MHRIYYTHKGFLRWVIEAFMLAFITTFVPALVLGSDLAPGDGDHGLDALGVSRQQSAVSSRSHVASSWGTLGRIRVSTIHARRFQSCAPHVWQFTGMFILTLGVNGRLFLEVHNATYLEAVSYSIMIFFLFFLAFVFSNAQCVRAL